MAKERETFGFFGAEKDAFSPEELRRFKEINTDFLSLSLKSDLRSPDRSEKPHCGKEKIDQNLPFFGSKTKDSDVFKKPKPPPRPESSKADIGLPPPISQVRTTPKTRVFTSFLNTKTLPSPAVSSPKIFLAPASLKRPATSRLGNEDTKRVKVDFSLKTTLSESRKPTFSPGQVPDRNNHIPPTIDVLSSTITDFDSFLRFDSERKHALELKRTMEELSVPNGFEEKEIDEMDVIQEGIRVRRKLRETETMLAQEINEILGLRDVQMEWELQFTLAEIKKNQQASH